LTVGIEWIKKHVGVAFNDEACADFVMSDFVTPKEFVVHMQHVGLVRIMLKDAERVKTVYLEGEKQ